MLLSIKAYFSTVLLAVVTFCYSLPLKAGGAVKPSHGGGELKKDKNERKKDKEGSYYNKVKDETSHIIATEQQNNMSTILDPIPVHVRDMLQVIHPNKMIEDTIEHKERKDKKVFYDEKTEKICIVCDREEQFEHNEVETILKEVGTLWAAHLLSCDADRLSTHLADLLNKVKKENESGELVQLSISGLDFLGLSFVENQENEFSSEQILKHKEEIKQLFGELFRLYYGSVDTRKILKDASATLYSYMENVMIDHSFYKNIKNSEQPKRIQNIKWASQVSKEERTWIERYEGEDPKENQIAKKVLGSIKGTKKDFDLEFLKEWLQYRWFEADDMKNKNIINATLKKLESMTGELKDAVTAIEKTNELVKRISTVTEKDQTVYVYFDLKEWGYYEEKNDSIDWVDSSGKDNDIELIKNFTYGYLPGIPVAELMERDNDNKRIRVKLHVPKGSMMANLGGMKVAFPMDYYGLERTAESEVQTNQSGQTVTIEANLVPKNVIENKKNEHVVCIRKLVDLASQIKKLKMETRVLIQKLIQFDFKGPHIQYGMDNAKQTLLDWILNPLFSNEFIEGMISRIAKNNSKSGFMFKDYIPNECSENLFQFLNDKVEGRYYDDYFRIHLGVALSSSEFRKRNPHSLTFIHELGHLVKDLLFNRYPVFAEEIIHCFNEEKKYLDERTTDHIEGDLYGQKNEEEFFAEVFRNMYATRFKGDTSPQEARRLIADQTPKTVKLIETAMAYMKDGTYDRLEESDRCYDQAIEKVKGSHYLRAKIDAYYAGETKGVHGIGNQMLLEFDGDVEKMRNEKIQLEQKQSSNKSTMELVHLEKALLDIDTMNEYILQAQNETKQDQVVYFEFNPEDWGYSSQWGDTSSLENALKCCRFPCLQTANILKTRNKKRIQVQLYIPRGMKVGHLGGGKLIFSTNCGMKMIGKIEQLDNENTRNEPLLFVKAQMISNRLL